MVDNSISICYNISRGDYMKTKSIIITGLFAAIICVFSVMTIPIGSVPITLSIFAVFLTAIVLGFKKGTLAVLIYILLGGIGLPVFSSFRGGISVLLGPTGGYIIGYIFIAVIVGLSADLTKHFSAIKKYVIIGISSIFALAICYTFGTAQFIFITKNTLTASLAACVYPFIPFDLIKIVAALFIGNVLKSRLKILTYNS